MAEACAIAAGVRIRPYNARERKYNSKLCVDMPDGQTTAMIDPKAHNTAGVQPRKFTFDFSFWTFSREDEKPGRPFADQAYVYEKMGAPLLENILSGRNACLFAYGQTGAGKSYSMLGAPGDPGVLPRLVQSLFANVDERKANGVSVRVECQFCEIYNEACMDLLQNSAEQKALKVRQDPKLGIFVQGLTKASTTTFEQFDGLMTKALDNRAVSSTNMNATSSRSHAVIMLNVVQVEAGTSCTRTAKLSMVDLAGSERAESTGATGSTLNEAKNINSSLSCLGMCLSRLADIAEGKKGLHVPFRDSQLTWLLSDNLGGNSRTSMLAAISPADVNYEETLSTLRFASITKRVKTVAIVNESANDKLIRELREELSQLQGQLADLKKGGAVPDELARAVGAGAGGGDGDDEGGAAGDEDDALQPSMSALQVLGGDAAGKGGGGDDDGDAKKKKPAVVEEPGTIIKPPADWKAPQFVNMSPGPSSATAQDGGNALGIFEGDTPMKIGKNVSIVVNYSGLTGETTLRVTKGDVFFNGNALEVDGPAVALKQNDRVIAFQDVTQQGDNVDVLRFSHYQAVLDEEGKAFRTDVADGRHCELLEGYGRTLILKEALDEFMLMCNVNMEMPPAHEALFKAIADALVVAEAEEQSLHAEQFAKETALTDEYPQLEQTEEFKVDFDAEGFAAGMSEKEQNIKEKDAQLQRMKAQMEEAAANKESEELRAITLAKATAAAAEKQAKAILESAESEIARLSADARAEENALQERLDEGAAERVYAVELAYHKEVRQLQKFRPAPADPEDLAIFKRMSSIIQNDAALNCIRMAENVELCDPLVSQTDFVPRTVCVSKRFLFVYQKLYRREPLLFAMYLPGARCSLTYDGVSKRHVVDLTAACARSPAPEHQRDPPQVRLRFGEEREARAWRAWFEDCALPNPPMSIWKVKLEAEFKGGSAAGQHSVEADPGKPFEMKGWVSDDSTTNCTRCNAEFGFFRRKHHCRTCGFIFCGNCLDSKKVCVECQKAAAAAASGSSSPAKPAAATAAASSGGASPAPSGSGDAAAEHSDPNSPSASSYGNKANNHQIKSRTERHRLITKESVERFSDGGKSFACYLRARIVGHPTRRRCDDFAVSLAAEEAEKGTLGMPPAAGTKEAALFRPYLLDLFRGRFHEWCGVDISHVWRCSFHPLAVHVRLTQQHSQQHQQHSSAAGGDDASSVGKMSDSVISDSPAAAVLDTSVGAASAAESTTAGAPSPGNRDSSVYSTEPLEDTRPKVFVSIFCTSVADRERLFEGIALMIGRRGFTPIRSGQGSNEHDVLVLGDEQKDQQQPRTCGIRLTNQLRTQLRIRVSHQVEGAKFHFQQGDFDLIAATAHDKTPPWTRQYLRSAGMVQLSDPIPLSPGTSFFVAASDNLAQHTTPPVSANARGICGVMLGIHESSLLLVASTADDIAGFEDVTDDEHSELFKDEVEAAESEGPGTRKSASDGDLGKGKNSAAGGRARADSTDPQIGSPQQGDPTRVWSPDHPPANNDQKGLLMASALPLERLLMWPLRDVDPVEQFENVIVVGHHVQLSNGFTPKDKCGIQFRSADGQVVVESASHMEACIMVPHIILDAFRLTGSSSNSPDGGGAYADQELPAHINVKIAKLREPTGTEVSGPHDSRLNVVANTPFEHCTEALTNASFGAASIGSGGEKAGIVLDDSDLEDDNDKPAKRVGNTIRLLSHVAEHSTSKNLFAVIKDYGTATVPFFQFMQQKRRTCILTAPVMYCGIQTGEVDLAISLS